MIKLKLSVVPRFDLRHEGLVKILATPAIFLSCLSLSSGVHAADMVRVPVPAAAEAADEAGQAGKAYELTAQALAQCERQAGESESCLDLLVAASNFARKGAPDGQDITLAQRAVAVAKRVTGESFDTAAAYNNLGLLLADKKSGAEAVVAMSEALRLMRIHGEPEALSIVAYNLAEQLAEMNRIAEAEAPYREALAAIERTPDATPLRIASRIEGLAILLMRLSRMDEAERLTFRAVDLSGSNPLLQAMRTARLARLIGNQGRYDQAISLQRDALSAIERISGSDSGNATTERNNLAVQLMKAKRYADAEPLLRQVLQWHEGRAKPDLFDIAAARANLGELLTRIGRAGEGERFLRLALRDMTMEQGADNEFTGHLHALLGLNLAEQRQWAAAEAELREAYRVRTAPGVETRTDWIAGQADLAKFLAGRPARAGEARARYLEAERGIAARAAQTSSERDVRRELTERGSIFAGHVAANWQLYAVSPPATRRPAT